MTLVHFNRVSNQEQADAEIARLVGVMADALAAMDDGRYGDARRLLSTGKAPALKPVTAVIARNGGAA